MPTMVQEIADGVTYMELYNRSLYNDAVPQAQSMYSITRRED